MASTSTLPTPPTSLTEQKGPFWGSVAAVLGGFLLLLEGTGVSGSGGSAGDYTLTPASEGLIMVVLGGLTAVLGWAAYYQPQHHRADGASIWILSTIITFTFASLWSILSLYDYAIAPGLILTYAGASHIFWWKPKRGR